LSARLICIVGIDGSGKSTLAGNLQQELRRQGMRVGYAHSFHNPFLLKPAKWIARGIFMRRVNQFGDYSAYRAQKSQASSHHPVASQWYGRLWLFDYSVQAFFGVSLQTLWTEVLLLDRYIYDTVINISSSLGWSEAYSLALISKWLKIYPRPEKVFLIDIPETVAFSRKNDIPSVEYLRERRHRYLALAKEYGFVILDGEQSQEALLSAVKKSLHFE
jgi:dTMP kinase